MKQTALQNFWDNIALKLSVEQINEFLPEFEQAKQMEKEQIMDAYMAGESDGDHYDDSSLIYYIDTFKIK